ncbi:MAG TPA: glycosyltransferase family 2 protein [Solirubrobacterales bacterium]|jgi:glycosyltransferase involved in cell wall biosynthesis|nr:glycosyltransferase family 2 protein [Solirubrobacterales bacterium]
MVSLVMPTWKPHASWFPEAVSSALEEDRCEIELIVVDDGNPEPVAALLSGIDDPRLEVIAIPHRGVGGARNAGIERASGEAIRFVDADDVVEPGSTAKLLELSGPDGAIGYGSTLVCDIDLRPEKTVGATVQGDALVECMLGNFFVYITGMLFPRRVIEAAGDFDTGFEANGDYDYVLRALEHAPVRGEDFVASRYRRHGASITGRQPAAEVKSRRALDKLFERRPDLRGTRVERQARSHFQLGAATRMLRAGQLGACARHLLAALRLAPLSAAPAAAKLLRAFPRQGARRLLVARRRWARPRR